METIEVVIKIPKEIYEELNKNSWDSCFVDNELVALEQAFCNSIVLPKNHGRLIDAEQLMNYCQNQIDGHKYADCNVIARFPTILDAEVEHDD